MLSLVQSLGSTGVLQPVVASLYSNASFSARCTRRCIAARAITPVFAVPKVRPRAEGRGWTGGLVCGLVNSWGVSAARRRLPGCGACLHAFARSAAAIASARHPRPAHPGPCPRPLPTRPLAQAAQAPEGAGSSDSYSLYQIYGYSRRVSGSDDPPGFYLHRLGFLQFIFELSWGQGQMR